MKKRILLTIGVLACAAMLGACGSQSGDEPAVSSATQKESVSEAGSSQAKDTKEEETPSSEETVAFEELNPLLAGFKTIPIVEAKYAYPTVPYQYIEKGYNDIFLVDQQRLISVSAYRRDDQPVTTPQEAFDFCTSADTIGMLTFALDNYCALRQVKDYEVEELEINGMKVNRYEGTVLVRSSEYEAYMYAYSFVFKGRAAIIYSCVYDMEGQTQEQKDEVKEIVDLMMESFRDNE